MMRKFLFVFFIFFNNVIHSQEIDSLPKYDHDSLYVSDSILRITNLNPYFTLHVDSTLSYQLQINKNPEDYFWFLKNSPVGLRIDKDNGSLRFKAEKAYFLSGKLKYDVNYKVQIGVQNLHDPTERIDTAFTIVFYNTEIIPSRVKPNVRGPIYIDEGDTIRIKILCEEGSFPFLNILTDMSRPIPGYKEVTNCNGEFSWTPAFDFVKESDSAKVKIVDLSFIGTTRFQVKDTAHIRLIVRDALNYPLALEEYKQTVKNTERYVTQLKFTFLQLDKKLKKTKSIRTSFDLTSASTSVTGTIMATSNDEDLQRIGKILPSIGLSMVPIKEAAVPNRSVDQNQAASIRSSIKRLEYMLGENSLIGERDWEITKKTNNLRNELKQIQIQLIDVPLEFTNDLTEEELNQYFNSPKVNKKYRLKTK